MVILAFNCCGSFIRASPNSMTYADSEGAQETVSTSDDRSISYARKSTEWRTISAPTNVGVISITRNLSKQQNNRRRSLMGASVRQKDGNWYVFVRHGRDRAAQKCLDEQHAIDTAKAVLTAIAAGQFDITNMRKNRQQ